MNIKVILGTTREGRISDRLAKWVMATVADLPDATVELMDLKDYPLPFFTEPISPKYNADRKPSPDVAKWLDSLREADGYIVITPEYNRTMPGVLKNAIDYIAWEIDRKPVAIVSHGVSGGAQAAENIRTAIRQLGAVNVSDAVSISGAMQLIDEDGNLAEEAKANPYGPQAALKSLLDGLVWYGSALKTARDQG